MIDNKRGGLNKTLIAAAVAGDSFNRFKAQAQTGGYATASAILGPLYAAGEWLAEQSTPNKWPEWDVPATTKTVRKANMRYVKSGNARRPTV